jgi:pyruvate/2-oxoglutarate dehydrogenase complex dihydrolipoamide dehydrogenase (E3) component
LEKEDHLGGALKVAASLPFKSDLREYLAWAVRTSCNTPNLDIRLLTEASPETIKAEQPDILIVAVGSEPVIPAIPGCDNEKVVLAGEVSLGTAKVGNTVVVAGAGLTGLETALQLAREGKKVTVIDLLSWEEIHGPYPVMNLIHLKTMLRDLGVEIKHNFKLEEITAGGVIVTDKQQVRTELYCDSVVLALGYRPRQEVMEKMQDLAPEVIFVGDCTKERGNLQNAITQGFNAAIDLGLNLSL